LHILKKPKCSINARELYFGIVTLDCRIYGNIETQTDDGPIIDSLPASVIWLVCGYHITIATLEKPDKTLAFSDRKEGCPNQH
jgi:hypothetical protein